MEKVKILIVALFCLGIVGVALAVEVINIDINGYGDDTPYTGTAAYDDGINEWDVYYGGWGKAKGSPRSSNLRDYNEPNLPSTYAAQVWVAVGPATDYNYVYGTELLDDGFVKEPLASPNDPNIYFFGQNAYTGVFDMYVYGANSGSFTLTVDGVNTTKGVSGTYPPGQFVENGNYVIFPAVDINDLFHGNCVLSFTNILNGIQLVSTKRPVDVNSVATYTTINAVDYDVAYETNGRSGEGQPFGPDVDYDTAVVYIDGGEYMIYDINVPESNEYEIRAYVRTQYGPIDFDFYLDDDISVGTFGRIEEGVPGIFECDLPRPRINLFKGSHTLKWRSSALVGGDICYFRLYNVGDVNMTDCNDVYKYHIEYSSDYIEDCRVDEKDLDLLIENWLDCYSPDANDCL